MIDASAKIDGTAVIHETAIIGKNAVIGPNVEIGPWTLVGDNVEIGEGTKVLSHAVLKGPCRIGKRNLIYQFASIGEDCQDKKYAGEATTLEIGDDNVFREHCTVHRGTVQGLGTTKVGSRNLFMVNAHVAHDCIVGDDCILANNATLAGHVVVGDYVIFGGLSAIHQFGRVGSHAFVQGTTGITMDCPPYVMCAGHIAKPVGVNKEGLKRRGFTAESIAAIEKAYKVLYRDGLPLAEAKAKIAEMAESEPAIKIISEFLEASQRGIIRPAARR